MTISNKKFIETVEKEKLLGEPVWKNIGLKKNLLKRLGYVYLFENNRYHIKVEGASPETVVAHLEGAYLCALRDKGWLYS